MKKSLTTYLDGIQTFSTLKDEPSWMRTLRQEAVEKTDELALPYIERVKYNRWPLFNIDKASLNGEVETTGNVPDFDAVKNRPVLVQQDQQNIFEQLPQELVDQGVIFTDIFSAMHDYPELVENYYMQKAVPAFEDKMTAAHAAFMNSGVFLYVPKNVTIKQPLEALFYHNGDLPAHYFKHVLIVADENSEFSYLERFMSNGDAAKKVSGNIIVEVVAKKGARVKFSAIDQLGKNISTYMNRRGYLMRDASIDWALGVMNSGNIVADFDSDLVGEAAHAEVKAVAISAGHQIQAIDTRVTNKGKHTIGHILQHGVIRESGTLTFNGIGHILHGAKGADAQQESRVLNLSDRARGDANPILLIDENEIGRAHV